MTQPFQKHPECERCMFFTRNPHLYCAVHPHGGDGSCPSFVYDPAAEQQQQAFLEWEQGLWEPVGASYYNGELVLQPRATLTPEEQAELLDWHPIFTGRCPECEMPLAAQNPPQVHWDCEHCGWKDDTV